MRRLIVVLLFASVLLPVPAQAVHVVINSADWRDVYTGLVYAGLKGYDAVFLKSEYDLQDAMNRIPKISPDVILIESEDVPFMLNYEKELEKGGFRVQKVLSGTVTANMALADDINASGFIVVGSAYGYDAISVASYAIATGSYVFLADGNATAIADAIRRKGGKVLTYGYLDPKVQAAFKEFNPQVIYEGDKYLDNMKIVEKFLQVSPTTQAYLTSGDFIEPSIFSKDYPTIFVGKDVVPEEVKNFIANHIDIGVLVGNELFNAVTPMKDEIKKTKPFSLIIKFARGASAGGSVSYVMALDMFPVPSPATNISVTSVKYNLFTHQMEIVFRNNENTPTYFKSTIAILTDGARKRTLGDEKINFIGPLDTIGLGYDIDLTELINASMVLDVRIFTQYGAGVVSLTNIYEETFRDIDVFSAQDRSQGRFVSLVYNKAAGRFEAGVENIGDYPLFCRVELSFSADGKEYTAVSNGTVQVGAHGAAMVLVPYDIGDLAGKVATVKAVMAYGERTEFLVNRYEKEFPFAFAMDMWWLWIIILLLILLALYAVYRRVSE